MKPGGQVTKKLKLNLKIQILIYFYFVPFQSYLYNSNLIFFLFYIIYIYNVFIGYILFLNHNNHNTFISLYVKSSRKKVFYILLLNKVQNLQKDHEGKGKKKLK